MLAAERPPVLETIEPHEELTRTGVHVGALVVNKRSPADRGDFLARRRAVEEEHLATLRAVLPEVPCQEVPLGEEDVVGPAALARFAESLDPAATGGHGARRV
ncbi:ArsA-related P-loop ATPase [Brachybacterium sp. GPGPB12]|uniref:ArsA-related P-loop ATPase n=1 Tax=Brachybacterium sp. GPGPB12 TaxID=3023517 RepID=UPI0031343282